MSRKTTLLDTNQIVVRQYDEENEAIRAVIVGGADIKLEAGIDLSGLEQIMRDSNKEVEVKVVEIKNEKEIFHDKEIVKIEVPVIVEKTNILEIEKPVLVPEIRVVDVEKPVIIEKTVLEKVEVPVIVEKLCVPNIIWALVAVQTLVLLLLAVKR